MFRRTFFSTNSEFRIRRYDEVIRIILNYFYDETRFFFFFFVVVFFMFLARKTIVNTLFWIPVPKEEHQLEQG